MSHHFPIEDRITELQEEGRNVHRYYEPFSFEDIAIALIQLGNGECVALSHGEAVRDSEKVSKILEILGISYTVSRYKDGRMIEPVIK